MFIQNIKLEFVEGIKMEFREIDKSNYKDCMTLTVDESQKYFV